MSKEEPSDQAHQEAERTKSSIYCWIHDCDKSVIQLSREVQIKCSLCDARITNDDTKPLEKIVEIHRPFTEAKKISCDVVLIPAKGSFEDNNFTNNSGLHIGICDDGGRVLEFDKDGIKYDDPARTPLWQQCVALGIIEEIVADANDKCALKQLWAEAVGSFRHSFDSTYERNTFNCLDFIMEFLVLFLDLAKTRNAITSQQVENALAMISDKVAFCQHIVVKQTSTMAKYVVLNRKLQQSDVAFIQDNK